MRLGGCLSDLGGMGNVIETARLPENQKHQMRFLKT